MTQEKDLPRMFDSYLYKGELPLHTQQSYHNSIQDFYLFLSKFKSPPLSVNEIGRFHINLYLMYMAVRQIDSHQQVKTLRALRAYFAWLVEIGELKDPPYRFE